MKRIPSLEALGLTRLESLCYAWLVGHPACTGYGVAKGIGKPTANVYRALETLQRKGAVRADRASPPLFRAVPPDELLEQLEREFHDRREIAAQALARLSVPETEREADAFFPLRSPDQVFGRARIALAAARRVVILLAGEREHAMLAPALDDARARGVRVERFPPGTDGMLRLVSDGREAVVAVLDGDDVREGVWTRSPGFVRSLHDALASEAFYAEVARGMQDGTSVDEVEAAFERCRALRALIGG